MTSRRWHVQDIMKGTTAGYLRTTQKRGPKRMTLSIITIKALWRVTMIRWFSSVALKMKRVQPNTTAQ